MFLIICGDELVGKNKKIIELKNKYSPKVVYSLSNVYYRKNLFNKFNNYLLYHDTSDASFDEDRLKNIIIPALSINNQTLIIVFNETIKKNSKLYKLFKDNILEFNRLSEKEIIEKLNKITKLSLESKKELISLCNYNYSLVLSEIDKLKTLCKVDNISEDEALNRLKTANLQEDNTFILINALLTFNKKELYTYLLNKTDSEEPIITLSKLYTTLRNIIIISTQEDSQKILESNIGINSEIAINIIKNKYSYLLKANSKAKKLLELTYEIINKIKLGEISSNIAIDYLIIKFFEQTSCND